MPRGIIVLVLALVVSAGGGQIDAQEAGQVELIFRPDIQVSDWRPGRHRLPLEDGEYTVLAPIGFLLARCGEDRTPVMTRYGVGCLD